MNIEALRAVQDRIREEGNVDMRLWQRRTRLNEEPAGCGTVGCIAGWALYNAGFELWDRKLDQWPEYLGTQEHSNASTQAPRIRGQELLGLTDKESSKLFYHAAWPPEWREKYLAAEDDPCTRAKVVHDLIDEIIEKGIWW